MTELWHDLTQLSLATLIAPLLGPLPGMAALWVGVRLGWVRPMDGWAAAGLGTLIGLAILPAFDAVAVRYVGLGPVALVHAAAGLAGLAYAIRLRWTFEPTFMSIAALWWGLVAASMVDVGMPGGLWQSLIVIDLVKHAAVVEAIVRDGLPLVDPFFNRPVQAGYYYYYYLWGAQTEWLSGGLLSGRIAYTGTLIWTGPAFLALLWQLGKSGGFARPGRERRLFGWSLFLCFISGADFPAMLLRWWIIGVLEQQTDSWTEEIRFALTSTMWTPHHLSALIATWVALLAAVRARNRKGAERSLLILGAGAALATVFGSSVWIAITAGLFLAGWSVINLRRQPTMILILFAASAVAVVFALPQFHDLRVGRAPDGFPIAPTVRMVLWWRADLNPQIAPMLLLLLPTVYALEFGAFAYGSALYRRLRSPIPDQTAALVRSLLLASAITGLLVGSFLRSTILNNDLGWRAPWFAQLAAMIWTASVMQHMPRLLKPPRAFIALLALGVLPNIYDIIGLRFIRPAMVPVPNPYINAHPDIDRSLRAAYGWANAHLPANAVLQHNPRSAHRVFDFGLYGHFRTGVADREATLFGASQQQVTARLNRLKPIFEQGGLIQTQLLARAKAEGIDTLVFIRTDPAWAQAKGPPASLHCVWRDENACIAPIGRRTR